MEKERERLKALLRKKHRALLAIQERLLRTEASEEEVERLRREVKEAQSECERLRGKNEDEEDLLLPSVSLPSAVMSNNDDEMDADDTTEWKNMFRIVSKATKHAEEVEKNTLIPKPTFHVEDLLRLVSQEALNSSLEDTSFSWMSDHLPSAIASAIQNESSSHATSVALYYIQSNKWTNPFCSCRFEDSVTKEQRESFDVVFDAPIELPDIIGPASRENRCAIQRIEVPVGLTSFYDGLLMWKPLLLGRAVLRVVQLWRRSQIGGLGGDERVSSNINATECVRVMNTIADPLARLLPAMVEIDEVTQRSFLCRIKKDVLEEENKKQGEEEEEQSVVLVVGKKDGNDDEKKKENEMKKETSSSSSSSSTTTTTNNEESKIARSEKTSINEEEEEERRKTTNKNTTTIVRHVISSPSANQENRVKDLRTSFYEEIQSLKSSLAEKLEESRREFEQSTQTKTSEYENNVSRLREELSAAREEQDATFLSLEHAENRLEQTMNESEIESETSRNDMVESQMRIRELETSIDEWRYETGTQLKSSRTSMNLLYSRFEILQSEAESRRKSASAEIFEVVEARSRAEQQIAHESFVAEQANIRAESLRSEVESLQAQIHTIRDSERQRLSTFRTSVNSLEIKCKTLQEKSDREAKSNEALSKRQKLIASALAALEGEKNSWAVKLKSAALEFGVQSAQERTKYKNRIQTLESEIETLNRDLRRSETQRREDLNLSAEKLREVESEIERTELATWEREQKRFALSNAFGRLRHSAENWRVRGLEESLRASLQAQAEMREIHDEDLERSRDSSIRMCFRCWSSVLESISISQHTHTHTHTYIHTGTTAHLRSIQNRIDAIRQNGEQKINVLRHEYENSMRREAETVRELRSEYDLLNAEMDSELQSSMDRDNQSFEISDLRKRCRLLEAEAETEQDVAVRARKESIRIASIAKRDMSLADEALAEADRRFLVAESLLEKMKRDATGLDETILRRNRSPPSSTKRHWYDANHTNGPFT